MTFEHDPRMGEDDAEAWVARLVRAGRTDGPSRRALAAAPGAVATLLSSEAAAAAAAQVGAAGSAAAAKAGASVVSPLLVAKWVGVGALASSSALALLSEVPSSDASREVRAAPVASAAPAERNVAVVPQPVLPAPQASATPLKVVPTPAPQSDLAREVAALDAARQALVDGDAARALRQLSDLERSPTRALAPEATVLRVRALLAQGDSVQARRVAGELLAAAPDSPQAKVVRRLIERSEMQTPPSRL